MNLQVTKFQVTVVNLLRVDDVPMTTYEISRRLKRPFHRVRKTCVTLYLKGFIDNVNKCWVLRKGKVHQTSIRSVEDCNYS